VTLILSLNSDFGSLIALPWQIRFHAASFLAVLITGLVLLALPRGGSPGRAMAHVWTALILVTIASAPVLHDDSTPNLIRVAAPLAGTGLAALIMTARRGILARRKAVLLGAFVCVLAVPAAASLAEFALMAEPAFNR
jgi:uncharacterized membrane protein